MILTAITFTIAYPLGLQAGTCTTISRTDAAANSILTSTKYNTDLNTSYSAHNAFDGGCVTDGTLEDGALNSTDFAVPLNAIREGCVVTKSDNATVSVDRCMIAVGDNFLKTTSATTATWGCSGCAAEVVSTVYYVAIKDQATTLAVLITTDAPNGDGYDTNGNRVIGKFFNDASGNIQNVEMTIWGAVTGKPVKGPTDAAWGYLGAYIIDSGGTPTVSVETGKWISSITDEAVGDFTINIISGIFSAAPLCTCTAVGTGSHVCSLYGGTATSAVRIQTRLSNTQALDDSTTYINCIGAR